MRKSNRFVIVIVLLIMMLLIWGLIGSSQAAKIGTTCDFGIGEKTGTGEPGSALCWKWHRNTIGQIGDDLQGLFGSK